MNDIALVEAILQAIYPFVFLYAWYRVHTHNKRVERVLFGKDGKQDRLNGRMDELIAAREEIARRKGVEEGIAIGLATREES